MKFRILAAAAAIPLFFSVVANAAEIRVMATQAPEQALRALVPEFEKATGHKVTASFAGMVEINRRIEAGESWDVLIMARPEIDLQTRQARILAKTRVDFVTSSVVVAIRQGAPKPDISTTEAVKKTLLAAKSIGYSSGPSGVYIIPLFKRLGIYEQVKGKLKQTPTTILVGSILASGEVEIALHQVGAILGYPGCEIVGPLPDDIQYVTEFSAALMVGAKNVDVAKEWLKFLTSPAAAAAYRKTGLEPL